MAKQKKVLTKEQYLSFIDPTPRVVIDQITGKPQLFTPANCAEWVRMYDSGEIIIVPKSEEKEESSKKNQSSPVSNEHDLAKMELGGDLQDAPEEFS